MYKLSLVSVEFARLHPDGVCKTMYLLTVTYCTCFLLPFTVVYIGRKCIADFHNLRITLLRKKINQNMNLTNEIPVCIPRPMTKVVFCCLFFIFCCLDYILSYSATNTQTFSGQVPGGPKDCPECCPFWLYSETKRKENWRKEEWESLWVCLWNPFEEQRKISYLAPDVPYIWSE